jgi:hypothetical protein
MYINDQEESLDKHNRVNTAEAQNNLLKKKRDLEKSVKDVRIFQYSSGQKWALIRYFVISLPLVTIVSFIERLDR